MSFFLPALRAFVARGNPAGPTPPSGAPAGCGRRRFWLPLAVAGAALLLPALTAHAQAPCVAATYTTGGTNAQGPLYNVYQQSFTATCSGRLTTMVFNFPSSADDLRGQGYSVKASLTDAAGTTVLATLPFDDNVFPTQTRTFDFSAANVFLTSGTQYRWELRQIDNTTGATDPNQPLLLLQSFAGNPYAGGQAFSAAPVGFSSPAPAADRDFRGWTVNLGPAVQTGTISGSPFCAGGAVSVPFTTSGTIGAGNVYTAQLSNASGSFAAPVSIGTLSSTAGSGTISATVPAGTASGTGYRIRVTASTAGFGAIPNTSNLTITNTPAPTGAASQSFAAGATVANLAATGTAIKWYATSSSTTALATTTPLTNGTIYYATQTVGGFESCNRLAVTVGPPNQAPTAVALSNTTIAENTGANAVVGTLSTTDPDAGDTFTYTLESGANSNHNALVNISGNTLRITASPDYETRDTYAVRIRATDAGGLFTEQAFFISITDVAEAPTALLLSNTTLAENVPANTLVGTFSATDPGRPAPPTGGTTGGTTGSQPAAAPQSAQFTYTLPANASYPDNAAFSISNGNELHINASPDFETKSSYSILARVTDYTNMSFEQAFTISITDVVETPTNAAPTGLTLSATSVSENVPVGTTIATVSTIDPDAGDTFTYALIPGYGGTDYVTLVGNELRTTQPLDFEQISVLYLGIETTDSGGLTYADGSLEIAVTDLLEDFVISTDSVLPRGTWRNVTVTGTGRAGIYELSTIQGTFRVQDGGQVVLKSNNGVALDGPGTFVAEDGATVELGAGFSLAAAGEAEGVVQTTGRTFSTDAIYVYEVANFGDRKPAAQRGGPAVSITGSGLPATVRELQVRNPSGDGGTLVLTQPVAVRRRLVLTDATLTTDGNALTLLSTAGRQAYVVHNNGGLTDGAVTVQRYLGGTTRVGYRQLSSPVQAAPVSDLTTSGFTPKVNAAYNALPAPALPAAQLPTIYGYDETRGGTAPAYAGFGTGYFSPASLSTTLTPGRGYSVYIAGGKTPDFVGALTTGNVAMALTVTGTNTAPNDQKAGWHLLGNPYPQPIDWDLATVPTGMSASISVFRTSGGNNGQYLLRANGVGSLPDGVLPLGQAFFARATAATTFTFSNALRVENSTALVARPVADLRPALTLTLQQTGAAVQDQATVYFEAGATTGLDARFDGQRPGLNTGTVPTLSTLTATGEAVAINGLPETALTTGTVVELALHLPTAGSYELAAAELANLSGTAVELLDRLTGTRYELVTTPVVQFTATTAGGLSGRFALNVGQRVLGTAAAAAGTSALAVYPNPASVGGLVRVTGGLVGTAVTVLDLAGRRVAVAVADASGGAAVRTQGLAAGVYVVRAADGRTTRLVVE